MTSIIIYVGCVLIGLVIGAILLWAYFTPKVKATQAQNDEIIKQNLEVAEQNKNLQIEFAALTARRDEVAASITELEQQAKIAGEIFFRENQALAEANFEKSAEEMSKRYQDYEEQCRSEYELTLLEASSDFIKQIAAKQSELANIESMLADMKALTDAAVEANKRAVEMEGQKEFYRLNLSDADIEEIEKLRSVIPYLRDSEPLNKVIWKVYYEKPYTDLIGRVVGNGTHTGIYKITNLENNMCYVGQAANIADRWKQHIKRGLGAETPTRNKLYPAMASFGVENFTFEIVEECDRALLNDREDYWQDYFHAKDFGYSIK